MNVAATDWHLIHKQIVTAARTRASQAHALGRLILRAVRAHIWLPMGMATFVEYAERYLGLTPRQTEKRLRVAFALERLPVIDAALASGEIHFSAVRELTRAAEPETEEEWLETARGKTVGEIERLVAGREPGDLPGDPERPRRHRLVIDVSPETFALFRDAQAKLRRETDEALSEEDGLMLMARHVLGGPGDDGRSPYQIHMTLCDRCGHATQDGRGQEIAVGEEIAEMAQCDAQVVGPDGRATQEIPPAVRRKVVARQHGRCGVPGCRNATYCDVHHVLPRAEGGTHDHERLM